MDDNIYRQPVDDLSVGAEFYTPTGWFRASTMIPLLAIASGVAVGMAYVLNLLEEHYYYFFITPLIVGLPVMGAIAVVVRGGHCRNSALGAVMGLGLMLLYYVGYWQISYRRNVVDQGPFAVQMVEMIGGAAGLPGYVAFRCKTSVPEVNPARNAQPRDPRKLDMVFNAVFFGLEAFFLSVIGLGIGHGLARRVYYERAGRWASTYDFRLPPETHATVTRAVEAHDWKALAALPRIPANSSPNTPSLLFRVEYLPDVADEPFYISLKGGPSKLVAFSRGTVMNQRAIPPESAAALVEQFPDLKAKLLAPVIESIVAKGVRPLDASSAAPPLSADADFRDRAVAASRALDPNRDASLCLPASPDGRREVRAATWRRNAASGALFVAGFGSLGAGLLFGDDKTPTGEVVLIVAVILMFAGLIGALVMMLSGDRVLKPALARRLRARPDSLLHQAEGLPTLPFRLRDPRLLHKEKWVPDDLVVVALDGANRRLLIDGLSHRYVVRGDDVVNLWPIPSGETLAVQIDYRIGPETLSLALVRANPMAHFFHGAFSDRPLKSLVRKLDDALGREFA